MEHIMPKGKINQCFFNFAVGHSLIKILTSLFLLIIIITVQQG